jgi:N-sulfoglucosamine sulfohydrolase
MNRREFVTASVAATLPLARNARRQPNILFIVAEDLSPRLGCYGDAIARTPRLDRLAQESVRYTNAFTTAPVCAPSRIAMITGMHQESIGGQHMRTMGAAGLPGGAGFDYQAVPPEHVKAFPELLRKAGYFACNAFKTDYQFGTPFSIWDLDAPDMFNWRKAPSGSPFFAMVNLMITHESYIWPVDMVPSNPVEAAIIARNSRDLAAHPPVTDPASVFVPPFLPDTPVVRRDIARFYDNIAIMDGQVGILLDALEADGLSENTIVVWTTDHGDGLPHGKRNAYDAGLRVPLLVRYPDRWRAGTVCEELFSFIDFAPSFLKLATARAAPWHQGRSAFGRRPQSEPPAVFAAADRMDEVPGKWRTARTRTHAYLSNEQPQRPMFEPLAFRDSMPTMRELWRLHNSGRLDPLIESQFLPNRASEELYDVRIDPDQITNIAAGDNQRPIMARMRQMMRHFRAATPDWSDETERQMVEHRMWPGLQQPVTQKPTILSSRSRRRLRIQATNNASIGWRYIGEDSWKLYSAPITIQNKPIETKAIRYGWRESDVSVWTPR